MPTPSATGLTTAARALAYWERRQEVTANNLANVSTAGFKAERVFGRMLDGATVAGTATDTRAGTLRETGNGFDLAIAGDEGFFVVNTAQGERLSRGGTFRLDTDGQVVDQNGNALLGDRGAISLPAGTGEFTVTPQGEVKVGGAVVDRLRLEATPDGEQLVHEGATLIVPGATRRALEGAERPAVRQGAIEESNVNSVSALVDMITTQRAYAAVQKAVVVLDDIRETVTTQIGKPV